MIFKQFSNNPCELNDNQSKGKYRISNWLGYFISSQDKYFFGPYWSCSSQKFLSSKCSCPYPNWRTYAPKINCTKKKYRSPPLSSQKRSATKSTNPISNRSKGLEHSERQRGWASNRSFRIEITGKMRPTCKSMKILGKEHQAPNKKKVDFSSARYIKLPSLRVQIPTPAVATQTISQWDRNPRPQRDRKYRAPHLASGIGHGPLRLDRGRFFRLRRRRGRRARGRVHADADLGQFERDPHPHGGRRPAATT